MIRAGVMVVLCVAGAAALAQPWSGALARLVAEGAVTQARDGRVSLDLRDVPVTDAAAALAQVGGVNVVLGPGVGGRITLRLQDVHWFTALDAVARAKGCVLEREGNVVWLATREERALRGGAGLAPAGHGRD